MATMISLKLAGSNPLIEDIEQLPGLKGLTLDREFGVVTIGPATGRWVVRTDSVVDEPEFRRRQSPEITGFYGDVHIEPVAKAIGEPGDNLQRRGDWFKSHFGE